MARSKTVESGKDRKTFVRDAGMGSFSFISILAGTLVAFASFAVLLAIVGGILAAIGIDTATLTANDYERLGIGGAVVAALVLFLSYFFGGYIAGRLARRAGALNGGLVLVLAIVIGAAVAVIVGTQADTQAVADNLRVIGVPTSGSDYGAIATVAGIVTLLAMIAGAVLGGIKGERWHGKLAARAFDPNVGPESQARHEVAEAQHRRTADYHLPAQHQHQHQHQKADREAEQTSATQQTAVQPTASEEAARQENAPPPPVQSVPSPDPATSGWNESERQAWGAPLPAPSSPDPDPEARPEQGDVLTDERGARPRRERPLRSGRRS